MSDRNTKATDELIRTAQSFSGVQPDSYRVEHQSLGRLLSDRARQVPHKVFLTYYDDERGIGATFTYAEFGALVDRTAAWLAKDYGIRRGDCVATLSDNHPLAAAALFACWRLGAVIAPQNVHEDDARIAFILGDAGAKALLFLPESAARAQQIAARVSGLNHVAELADPGMSEGAINLPTSGDTDLRALPALLVYTSGTTGSPKGVLLTQYNLLINALGTQQWHRIGATTRMMCVLPIHHVNGIVVTLATPLMSGSSVVLNKGFKASTFWRRLAAEHVAIVSVVPTILQFLCESAEDLSRLDLKEFRYFVCGAGTLPIALVQRFETQFGFSVIHGYGLSETTAFVCTMPVDLGREARMHWQTAFGYPSIGTPFAHVEMAIHDSEGKPLRPGARGEIVVRGHYVMSGYLNRPDANAETFKYGWFRTGDEGFYETDPAGRHFFFISGRLKELINRGGVKYSPFEIEEILLQIPGVKVGLAIAFPNQWYGEEVGAYIVKAEGAELDEEAVLRYCRGTMPFAKCPKVVVFGTEVPVTVTGKYQRLKLRDLFAAHDRIQFRER